MKNEGAKKKSSKTIDIVSYTLKVSVSGVKCVFVAHLFQVIRHKQLASTCPPKHMTGNNLFLHKALVAGHYAV